MTERSFKDQLMAVLEHEVDLTEAIGPPFNVDVTAQESLLGVPISLEVADHELAEVLQELYETNEPAAVEAWLRESLTPEEFESRLASFVVDGRVYYVVREEFEDGPEYEAS